MKWLEFASRFAIRGAETVQRQAATSADSSGSLIEELHGYTQREVDRATSCRVLRPDPAREIRYELQPAQSFSEAAGAASAIRSGATILQFRKAPAIRGAAETADRVSAA